MVYSLFSPSSLESSFFTLPVSKVITGLTVLISLVQAGVLGRHKVAAKANTQAFF